MILTAVFAMLSKEEIWNPCDLFKIDITEKLREKQKQKAIKQAIKLLESLRMTVVSFCFKI